MSNLVIKRATLQDMDFFLRLAKEEGWNPGIQDASAFYKTDPNGFFIGYLGDQKIGCISAVAYNQNFGFIGFYIVLPAFRSRGFGFELWSYALNYLNDRSIGLDGVLEQQKNYEKSNFQLYYKNYRFEGIIKGIIPSSDILDLKKIPFKLLLNYDSSIFGLEREAFLKEWIRMPNSYCLGKVKNEKITGYGVIRQCHNGFKIGPLFADNIDIAKEIIQNLSKTVKNSPVFLDIPDINPEAMQIAKIFNLKPIFATARMYNKPPPKQDLNKVFGITTFELG